MNETVQEGLCQQFHKEKPFSRCLLPDLTPIFPAEDENQRSMSDGVYDYKEDHT